MRIAQLVENVCLSYSYKVVAFASGFLQRCRQETRTTEEKQGRKSGSHVCVCKTEDIEFNGCEVAVQAISRTQLSYMYVVTP